MCFSKERSCKSLREKENIVAVLIFMIEWMKNGVDQHGQILLRIQLPHSFLFCWDSKGFSVTFSIYSIGILAIYEKNTLKVAFYCSSRNSNPSQGV